MPILNADQARNVVILKRSMRPGFAGIDNELFYDHRTILLFRRCQGVFDKAGGRGQGGDKGEQRCADWDSGAYCLDY